MPLLLQINSCLDKSTGRIAQQIGEKAMQAGFRSVIAYPVRAGARDSASNLLPIGTKADARTHALLTRLFDRHGLGSKQATRRLIKQIEALKPDIIHLHNIHGYYIHYPLLMDYLSGAGIPVVWTLHDCWPFTGHCVHFTDAHCDKWKDGSCAHCPKKKAYPASLFLDRSRQNYRDKKRAFTRLPNLTLVTVSHWLARMVKASFLKDYPLRVIQNGIDLKVFHPRTERVETVREKYGWQGKFVILGVATGWSEEVGMSTFIKLRRRLGEEYAIAMVGITPAQRELLPEGITAIGRTSSQEELAAIYSASDVLFNGSFQETFGLVTAESMACGTPVIVYDSTACPEIVTEKTGKIIPVGRTEALLEAIEALKAMPEEEKMQMSSQCVESVRTGLDKESRYQEYIDLYRSLLKD